MIEIQRVAEGGDGGRGLTTLHGSTKFIRGRLWPDRSKCSSRRLG